MVFFFSHGRLFEESQEFLAYLLLYMNSRTFKKIITMDAYLEIDDAIVANVERPEYAVSVRRNICIHFKMIEMNNCLVYDSPCLLRNVPP